MWGNFPQAYSHVGLIHAAFAASPRWADVLGCNLRMRHVAPGATDDLSIYQRPCRRPRPCPDSAGGFAPARAPLTVRVGTTGFGLEGSTALNEKVDLRAAGSLFLLGVIRKESDVSFDADLKLRSLAAYVDLHPTGGTFRFTGGLVYNKNRVEATGVPTGGGTFELNGVTYQASDVGRLTGVGRIGTRTWAPYLGIGFGSARGDTRLFFALDLGVVFQGPPRVDLAAMGPLAATRSSRRTCGRRRRTSTTTSTGRSTSTIRSSRLGSASVSETPQPRRRSTFVSRATTRASRGRCGGPRCARAPG